jgi:hypothetical protein
LPAAANERPVQVNVPVPPTATPPQVTPAGGVISTNRIEAGRESVRVTFETPAPKSLFDTTIVYVTIPWAATGSGLSVWEEITTLPKEVPVKKNIENKIREAMRNARRG